MNVINSKIKIDKDS